MSLRHAAREREEVGRVFRNSAVALKISTMRNLIDLVGDLGAGRSRGIIYAETPFRGQSRAVLHDPWSVLGPPTALEAFLDADLAHEYLRAWSAWQSSRPSPEAAAEALVAFAARPSIEAARPSVRAITGATER